MVWKFKFGPSARRPLTSKKKGPRADGQNLHVHTIGLHQGEALLDFFLADSRAFIPLGAGVRVPVTLRQVQIFGRPKVRMDVDARSFFCLRAQPAAEKKPRRSE